MTCKCKSRKADISCEKLRARKQLADCDDNCKTKLKELRQIEEEKEMLLKQEETERNRLEMEEFQRKYGSKKPKERKVRAVEVESKSNKGIYAIAVSSVVLLVAAALYFYL